MVDPREFAPDEFSELGAELRKLGAAKVATLAGLRFYQCPLSWFTDESHEIVRAVYLTEHTGRLLWRGEWADQPAWFVQAFEIYKTLSAEHTRSRMKKDNPPAPGDAKHGKTGR